MGCRGFSPQKDSQQEIQAGKMEQDPSVSNEEQEIKKAKEYLMQKVDPSDSNPNL